MGSGARSGSARAWHGNDRRKPFRRGRRIAPRAMPVSSAASSSSAGGRPRLHARSTLSRCLHARRGPIRTLHLARSRRFNVASTRNRCRPGRAEPRNTWTRYAYASLRRDAGLAVGGLSRVVAARAERARILGPNGAITMSDHLVGRPTRAGYDRLWPRTFVGESQEARPARTRQPFSAALVWPIIPVERWGAFEGRFA
jgi:hypothetical protein